MNSVGYNPIKKERIAILIAVILSVYFIILSRFVYLQIIKGEHFASIAESNSVQYRIIRPPRGVILDSRGNVLATNRASYDISFISRGVPRDKYENIADILSDISGEQKKIILEKMSEARKKPLTSYVLISDVSLKIVSGIEEMRSELPGVFIEDRAVRYYPLGPATAHLMGYIGEVSQKEVEESDTLIMGDWIGRAGIELSLENVLAGEKGYEKVEVDALGQITRVEFRKDALPGSKVTLTIDADLQKWAHEAFVGQKGAFVAIDPSNGRILALYSSPAYDPNAFVDRTRTAERMKYFSDTMLPLFNRALQSTYSPGSTFKTITMIAGLMTGSLKPSTRFSCSGSYYGMKCWKEGGHGTLDLISAYQHSCNVYFYQAGERIWIEPIHQVARAFGLDQFPGFGIGPEAHGVVPTPEWERKNVKGPDGEHWGAGDVRNTAIGQGYVLVSPAQMAQVAAGASMGGIGMMPGVVEKIESYDGRKLFEFEKRVRANLNLDSQSIDVVRKAMRLVVESGTGRRARVKDFDIGGKTGTAQNPENLDHAWFICAAPLSEPRIAICVLIEHAGHHGGTVAAPIAQYVLERYARREGIIK